MNINYLLSILDLYLMKEKNGSLIIEVDNIENLVKVEFCYSFDAYNKTFVKINKEVFFANISYFLKKVQGNLFVEKESFNNQVYEIEFDKERKLSFKKFAKDEMELIRNNLTNIKNEFKFEVEEVSYDQKYNLNSNIPRLSLSMGFTSYLTLFLTSTWFFAVLMLSLFTFKLFIS